MKNVCVCMLTSSRVILINTEKVYKISELEENEPVKNWGKSSSV